MMIFIVVMCSALVMTLCVVIVPSMWVELLGCLLANSLLVCMHGYVHAVSIPAS